MSKPYKEVNSGDPILATDWNTIQTDIRQHILTHAHTGTGESGAKIDITALAFGADMAVRKLSASESLTVGSPSQPLLSVNPAAPNQEGSYQVNIAGTLRADQVRTSRLDGITSLAVGTLAVIGEGKFTGPVITAKLMGDGASETLDIVGAGTAETNRKITLWAEGGALLTGNLMLSETGTPLWQAKLEVALPAADNTTKALVIGKSTTNYLTILNNGNVGIGTASPDSRLMINGNIGHDNNYSAYGDAPLTIFEPTHNGGSTPAAMRDILNLVREGVAAQAFGNKVSLALGRYEHSSTNSRTQLDIKLTDGSFNSHIAIMSLRSNGNVGIGTTNPAAKLSFNNTDSSETADGITWFNPTPTSYGIHRTAGAWTAPNFQQLRLGWQTGIILDPGTAYGKSYVDIQGNGLRVTAGNVGIGTSSPGAKLEVAQGAGLAIKVEPTNGNSVYIGRSEQNSLQFDYGRGQVINSTASLSFNIDSDANNTDQFIDFRVDGAGFAGGTSLLRILENGNVGIGTSTPGARLAVSGADATVNIETAELVRLLRPGVSNVKNSNSAGFRLGAFEQGVSGRTRLDVVLAGAPGNDNAWGSVPNVTVMTLLANGNVGLDTTSPTSKLHVDKGRVDITTSDVTGGGQNRFNGLLAWNEQTTYRRGQLVLSSSYSDLVIASSHANDNHGSTLTFATANPTDATDYRKWVMNQGNWGLRKQFLDFGYADTNGRANPHSNINGTDTVLTLDGVNKRVGIGTSSPGATLDIMQVARTGTHPSAVKGLYVTGDFGAASDGVEFRHSNSTQGIGFGFNTIYATGMNANQDLNLLPKGTGIVGIATSSSLSFGSQVRQMINLWGTGYGIGVQNSTQYFRTDKNFAWYKSGSHSDAELNAGANGTVQMVIKDGNVGIGTADPGSQRLKVQGGDIHCSGKIYAEGGLVFWWGPDGNWKRLDNRAIALNPGTFAGTVSENAPSDIRFKTDIRPLRHALEKVLQLQGTLYRWGETGLNYFTRNIAHSLSAGPNATEAEDQQLWAAEREKAWQKLAGENIGLIAQEVELVVPEVVHEDAEGYKLIRYQQLIALLVEAIKEQNALIQTLSGRVARLEAM